MKLLVLALSLAVAAGLAPGRPLPGSLARLRGGAVQAVSPTKLPAETYEALAEKGAINAKAPLPKALHQAFMGGMYVAIGGVFALTVAGMLPNAGPDLQRLVIGLIFPIGLIFILQAAGQLMTGNFMLCTAAWLEGKISVEQMFRAFGVAALGNTAGCLTVAHLIKEAGLLKGGTATVAAALATKKCAGAALPNLIKAVLCNWLVSLAIFLASSAADVPGKILGIWSCIPMFVTIGLEHSVANIFFLPFGKLAGAEVTVAQIITKNLIVVTLGNLIGGGGLLAAGMSFQFGKLGAPPPPPPPALPAGEKAP